MSILYFYKSIKSEIFKEMKKTVEQIDKELLELARKMIPLMEAKGFKLGHAEYGLDTFTIEVWNYRDDCEIKIQSINQYIETTREKL